LLAKCCCVLIFIVSVLLFRTHKYRKTSDRSSS
jgi:hypothetical protein